jgi:hypothetical protein
MRSSSPAPFWVIPRNGFACGYRRCPRHAVFTCTHCSSCDLTSLHAATTSPRQDCARAAPGQQAGCAASEMQSVTSPAECRAGAKAVVLDNDAGGKLCQPNALTQPRSPCLARPHPLQPFELAEPFTPRPAHCDRGRRTCTCSSSFLTRSTEHIVYAPA